MGSIYALVAAGFSLIYATNKFMHFAHGVSIALSGYLLYTFFSLAGIPFIVACILTIITTGAFGFGLYRFIYLPLQNRKASSVILLIASLALLVLFQNILQLVYGANVKSVGYITTQQGISMFGASITPLQIVIIVISFMLFFLLQWFMHNTTIGKKMRAVADNKELANIVGINYKTIASFSFFMGSAFAGIAGILISLERSLSPAMGIDLMVRGFTGAVIGGITSVPGSLAGSLLLGFSENFGTLFLPSGYKDAIAFTLLFLFLLFRPQGIFGINKGVKDV